jgi:hypothetical protein
MEIETFVSFDPPPVLFEEFYYETYHYILRFFFYEYLVEDSATRALTSPKGKY